MRRQNLLALATMLAASWPCSFAPAAAAELAESPAAAEKPAGATADMQPRYEQFRELMSGVKLIGRYTVLGKDPTNLPEEEYTILGANKLPNGDYWLIKARVKYGDIDVTLPMPLQVKWAEDTPVITLTDATIPGLGTFSSRVVIYNGKYAGTWTHGKSGGHLFGVLERLGEEDQSPKADDDSSP